MSDEKRQLVTATIAAPPADVFAVLADPARHTEIDGAGMLRGAPPGQAPVTKVGDAFLMEMSQDGLGDYQIRNEVVAFEAGRRIVWAPKPSRLSPQIVEMLGDIDPTGYTFGFELEAAGDGHTSLTHVYDWSGVKDERAAPLFPRVSAEQMKETVARLAKVVTG